MDKSKLFISAEIAEREIEMPDASKQVIFFRELENPHFERYFLQMGSKDVEVAARASAVLLAAGVCEPDGSPALTVEEAVRIKRKTSQAMLQALFDVNGYGAAAKGKQGNA